MRPKVKEESGKRYDLSGRQVNEESLRPGLYIRNGNKFIKN